MEGNFNIVYMKESPPPPSLHTAFLLNKYVPKLICTCTSADNIPHICIAEPNKKVWLFFKCSLAVYSDIAEHVFID